MDIAKNFSRIWKIGIRCKGDAKLILIISGEIRNFSLFSPGRAASLWHSRLSAHFPVREVLKIRAKGP